MAKRSKTKKKKSSASAKGSRSKGLNWNEKLNWLLADYLKKTKAVQGRMSLLSNYGDLLGDAVVKAKKLPLDWTSIGSLSSSLKSVAEGLGSMLDTGKGPILMGEDPKKNSWLLSLQGDWLLLGVKAPFVSKWMKPIQNHMKSVQKTTRSSGREALDGMSEASIDTALEREQKH